MNPLLKTALVAAALSAAAGAAAAQGAYGYDGYAAPVYSGDYGYAGPAIRGDYIGAPLTRFPRPTELVPSAWGYGTYGIPTVTGIRQAPAGIPTVYVIDAPAAARPRRAEAGRARILSRADAGRWQQAAPPNAGGARVVTVNVPR